MNCNLKLNNICKGEKFFGQVCRGIRPLTCPERRKAIAASKIKKRMILENPDYPELGMGA